MNKELGGQGWDDSMRDFMVGKDHGPTRSEGTHRSGPPEHIIPTTIFGRNKIRYARIERNGMGPDHVGRHVGLVVLLLVERLTHLTGQPSVLYNTLLPHLTK